MESTSSLTSMLSASSTSKVEVTLLRFNSQQNPDVDKKTATIETLSTDNKHVLCCLFPGALSTSPSSDLLFPV